MGSHDALCDRQSQAVAAGLAAAGLVGPVKAVEEVVQRLLLHGLGDRIGDRKAERAALLFQRDFSLALLRGIFQGVVQQDGPQLPDGLFVPGIGEHGLDGQHKSFRCV